MAAFARDVEAEVGITVSIGLAPNRFLAKFASDSDKPRGFTVIGHHDAQARLAGEPVSRLPGVGPAAARRLAEGGITHVGQLQRTGVADLMRRFGETGQRLKRLAHGEDDRPVDPGSERKSVSAEQTFDDDISDAHTLLALLRHLSEKVSTRLKASDTAGRTVTLKLKTADFRTLTRAERLDAPTAMAHRIFAAGKALLQPELGGRRFRLIGIGVSHLHPLAEADETAPFDPSRERLGRAEQAMDAVRARFGEEAVLYGLSLARPRRRPASPKDTVRLPPERREPNG
jgi:DNA polymerase-4